MYPSLLNNSHGLPVWLIIVLAALTIWSIVWKGFALWRAGRNNQLAWFIVMLILNTAGILEIIYLVWFAKPKQVMAA